MPKYITILFTLFLFSKFTLAQKSDIQLKIDSLQYLTHQPFACNTVYWRVVAAGKNSIPFLIDKLDDTTQTQVSLTCKKTNVRMGDICFEALTDICNMPLFYITGQQFDFIDQYGCKHGLFTYIDNNRQKFTSQIVNYYNKFKTNLKLIKYGKDYKND